MYWFRFTKDGKNAWVNLDMCTDIDTLAVGGDDYLRIHGVDGRESKLLSPVDSARLWICLTEKLPGYA